MDEGVREYADSTVAGKAWVSKEPEAGAVKALAWRVQVGSCQRWYDIDMLVSFFWMSHTWARRGCPMTRDRE